MTKHKTNEQLLRALLKDLGPVESAILRERLLKVAALTLQSIEQQPEAYANGFVHVSLFRSVCDKINQHLTD
jgi:hypothetical protein